MAPRANNVLIIYALRNERRMNDSIHCQVLNLAGLALAAMQINLKEQRISVMHQSVREHAQYNRKKGLVSYTHIQP